MASGRRKTDRLGTEWPGGKNFKNRHCNRRLWRIGQCNDYFMAKFLCHGNNRRLIAICRKRWNIRMFMLKQGLDMRLALTMHVNLALDRYPVGMRVKQRREALQ